MHGRYPDYNVLDEAAHWDEVTRRVVIERVDDVPAIRFFTPQRGRDARRVLRHRDGAGPRAADPGAEHGRREAVRGNARRLPLRRHAGGRETWRRVARGSRRRRRQHGPVDFALPRQTLQDVVIQAFCGRNAARRGLGRTAAVSRVERRDARRAERVLLAPVGVERDRLRRPGVSARLRAPRRRAARAWEGAAAFERDPVKDLASARGGREARASRGGREATASTTCGRSHAARCGRPENDSAFLLDVHRRAVPTERMARYDDSTTTSIS